MSFTLHTPKEITALVGQRARERRLERGWSQSELAARACIALATLKVFERTGQVSLPRLVRVMTALGRLAELETLLTASTPASLEALERPQRKRGRSSTLRVTSDTPAPKRQKPG